MAIGTMTIECSRSPSLISTNIKQEKIDSAKVEISSPKPQTSKSAITFSIENILSNNFGKVKKRPLETSDEKSTSASAPDAKKSKKDESESNLWPAWIFCTRYSDRPSSGKISIETLHSFHFQYNWKRYKKYCANF